MTGALVADGMVKRFGGLLAVDQLSLTVEPGHVVALIGPNGAGKTTFFNCLTGLLEPDGGTVHLSGVEITHWSTARRAQAGIGRTFQRLQVFTRMTVRQNLQVAAEATGGGGGVLRGLLSSTRTADDAVTAMVDATLDRLSLRWCAERLAGDLPTGVLRLVELGRALCARPNILLLDEPVSGLDLGETDHLRAVIDDLAAEGIGVLLVEHDVGFVLAVAETIYVLDFGRLIASGAPEQIESDPAVRAAYLGSTFAAEG